MRKTHNSVNSAPKRVRIKVYPVGVNFGWDASIMALNGREIATLDTPRPFREAARIAIEALAKRLGFKVVNA